MSNLSNDIVIFLGLHYALIVLIFWTFKKYLQDSLNAVFTALKTPKHRIVLEEKILEIQKHKSLSFFWPILILLMFKNEFTKRK